MTRSMLISSDWSKNPRILATLTLLCWALPSWPAQAAGRYDGHESVVTKTHRASLEARQRALRSTIARDSCWPHGAWGDTLWALSALSLNEKVASANARLLKRAKAYIDLKRKNAEMSAFDPAKETPWAYFALTDYVRILCQFRANSPHFPGRLRPETEAAMKEALWIWAKADSKVALASPDHLLVLLGTENHDLTRRPNHYLVAAILKDDPVFRERRYDDGHTAAEHFAAYKNLLYAPLAGRAGSSHSRVIETSPYQLPAAAILLRKLEFPAGGPFVIRNRVLGELAPHRPGDGESQRHAADSALVNYAYRTPNYLLGGTLQDPSLNMPDPETGDPLLKYGGISRQNRWCGMLFDDPAADEVCAVYPVIEKTRGGRPQHPHWSVQHENVLLLQRIAPQTPKRIGSYSTGRISIRFHGRKLEKVEEGGWIFAHNGKAFVGVKFLDDGHKWIEEGEEAGPADLDKATDKSRVLLHAGDLTTHGSFARFRAGVLANRLTVEPDRVEYRFGPSPAVLKVTLYDAAIPSASPCPASMASRSTSALPGPTRAPTSMGISATTRSPSRSAR